MNMQAAAYNFNNMLHTEALQKKYGKINLQILSDDDTIREVLLLDEDFTARTYALTTKNNEWNKTRKYMQ